MNLDHLLAAWLELDADPAAVAQRLNTTLAELLRALQDPETRALLHTLETFRALHHNILARKAQLAAAETLRPALDHPDPTERRRAATTLARIAHQILQPPKGAKGRESAEDWLCSPRSSPPQAPASPPPPSTSSSSPSPSPSPRGRQSPSSPPTPVIPPRPLPIPA